MHKWFKIFYQPGFLLKNLESIVKIRYIICYWDLDSLLLVIIGMRMIIKTYIQLNEPLFMTSRACFPVVVVEKISIKKCWWFLFGVRGLDKWDY